MSEDTAERTPEARGKGGAGTRPDGPTGPLGDAARAANLKLWNVWTKVHEKAPGYDVEGFKAGRSALTPVEREELGPYVHEGVSLLHLQCHFGLDTLSWAREGAEVVGLDFSGEAIALARRLAGEAGLSRRAAFVESDLYEADAHLGDRLFDIVFVNWGAIEWLPDLQAWAGIIARHLRPGGTFYLAEIHPIARTFEEVPGEHEVRVLFRYFPTPDEPDVDPVDRDYADPDARFEDLTAYGWPHSMEEVTGALSGAGLRIEQLHEFPFSPAPFWDWMVRDDERLWWLPDGEGGRRRDLPFTYTLRASKPAEEGAVPAAPSGRADTAPATTAASSQDSEPTSSAAGDRRDLGAVMSDEHREANLAGWDELAGLHVTTSFYDVEGFKAGRSSLTSIERDELGPVVREGTSLLHLQCHFGLDTLSWARSGATVTGVDFAPQAIELARGLADSVGLSARATFIQSDVHRLPEVLDETFDIVFTSWGALIWLPDLEAWADIVLRYLKPGGVFYIAEFHPAAMLLADHATPDLLRIQYPYFQHGEPLRFDEQGSYADADAVVANTVSYEWNHGLSEIVDPLLRRGLQLEFLHEFPYQHGLDFDCMEKGEDGLARLSGHPGYPLSFSLKMTRPGAKA